MFHLLMRFPLCSSSKNRSLNSVSGFLSAKPVKPKSFRLGSHGEGLTILWCGALAWRHNPQGIVGGASTRLLYI